MSTGFLLVLLIIVGLVLVLFPTMEPIIKKLLIAVAVVVFVAWIILFFGFSDELRRKRAQLPPSFFSSQSIAFAFRSM